MIRSINQVNEEFFKLFHNVIIDVKGKRKKVKSRYARKSSYDYVEEDEQIYPIISIQDYPPTPREDWWIDTRSYFGGMDEDGMRGYLFYHPVWMDFRFDVNIASKGYHEYIALQDYFTKNFVSELRFIFQSRDSYGDIVGVVVPYELDEVDIPRTDGVFETSYEFTLWVWLYAKEPKEVDLVQEIVVNLVQSDFP